jgi:hypothetical protein
VPEPTPQQRYLRWLLEHESSNEPDDEERELLAALEHRDDPAGEDTEGG